MAGAETIWIGRGNTIARQLLVNGAPRDLSGVSRAVAVLTAGGGRIEVDSDMTAGVFSWNGAPGVLTLAMGSVDIAPGTYEITLSIFDSEFTAGLVFPPFFAEARFP